MNKNAALFDLPDPPGRTSLRPGGRRFSLMEQIHSKNRDFRCIYCRNPVSTDPILAGVNNRNHCPYCLSSKHVDLWEAGDRMAACKAKMKPIGLTIKQIRKKYARANSGELMLVHQCVDCGKISINRIAADDDIERIIDVFEASFELNPLMRRQAEGEGVRLLGAAAREVVQAQLEGCVDYFGDQSVIIDRTDRVISTEKSALNFLK